MEEERDRLRTEEDGDDVAPASALFATKEDIHAKHARREGGNKRGREGRGGSVPPAFRRLRRRCQDGRTARSSPSCVVCGASEGQAGPRDEDQRRPTKATRTRGRRRMTRERSWGMLEEREFSYLTTAEVH